MTNCKFLIAGDVKGNFKTFFKKVSSVVKKKGPFDFVLCVGSFFGTKDEEWEHYIKKCLDIPLTVYILGPNSEEEREFYPEELGKLTDINSKVVYLGRKGNYTTCEGLRIGFLSGVEAKGTHLNEWSFGERDVKALLPRNVSLDTPVVDVLITSVWPAGVVEHDKSTLRTKNASKLLCESLHALKPWYHFAGIENVFYERSPYSNKNNNDELSSVTRFIAMASVGSNDKWLHAISLDLPKKFTHSELQRLVGTMTPSPFHTHGLKDNHSFRYDFSGNSKERSHKRNKGHFERNKKMKIDAEKECWFCLSSGKAENHLIISVGKTAYLSLNRGGLVSQHLNIFPIEHVASMSQASDAVMNDVALFKSLVNGYFVRSGFVVIFFERYYRTFHSQIHCVPLLPEMIDRAQEVFVERIEELALPYEITKTSNVHDLPPDQNYFHISFPSGSNVFVKIDSKFPLNFGRDVLVDKSLMNAEDKADWRNCVLTVDEETEIVNELRNHIKYEL